MVEPFLLGQFAERVVHLVKLEFGPAVFVDVHLFQFTSEQRLNFEVRCGHELFLQELTLGALESVPTPQLVDEMIHAIRQMIGETTAWPVTTTP